MTDIDQDIMQEIQQLRVKQQNLSAEQRWIQHHLTDSRLKERLTHLSIVSLHILTALLLQPKTGIELADELNVTRGGITRAARSLQNLGMIESFQRKDNHKKIYYSLTIDGQRIAETHQLMHQKLHQQFLKKIHARYSIEELTLVQRFLHDVNKYEQDFQ